MSSIEEMLEEVFGGSEIINLTQKEAGQVMEILTPVFCPTDGKTVEPIPSKVATSIPYIPLRVFCHYKGIYGVVTNELVDDLKELIGDDSAIEVGSGNGTLGKALGITCTDNYCQTFPDVVMAYRTMQQPTIEYGSHVERLDAVEAVKKYNPKVVVGSWITHRFDYNNPNADGNAHGPDEYQFFDNDVERYIMLGNDSTHNKKPLYHHPNYKTERIKNENYVSRSKHPELNTIYITTKK